MRLTEKDEQGNWCVKGLPWKNLYAGTPITKETQELLYGALRKLKDYEDTGLSPDEVETVNDFTKSQIAHLLKKYQEEKEKHEWIPCSERLPSTGRKVLLQTKGNQMVVAFLDKKNKWYVDSGDYFCTDLCAEPIAWQPLPESYKG